MSALFRPRLFQRYLMREVAAAIGLVLAAFIALFAFFDLINELGSVGRGGYTLGYALIYVALSLPGIVYELIPIATLIGTLYAVSTLARHSEISVLRASGLSTRDLLTTLFRVAAVLALATLIIGEGLVPVAERAAQELRARALDRVIAHQGFRSGLWLKDGRSFVNVGEATPDSRLQRLRIYRFDERLALESVTEAREGVYLGQGQWRLQEITRTALSDAGAKVERLDSIDWQSAVTPDLLSVLIVSPERMSLPSLVTYTRHLSENKQKTGRYEIALWKKLIYPFAVFVMVALALPFGYSYNRVGGVSLKIFSGVMFGIVFYMLNGLFSNLGIINAWPPLASAAMPSVLFLCSAMGMLWWVERR